MTTSEKITKPKRAIDYLPDDPFGALEKVWELEDVSHFIHGELTYWFYMALSHGGTIYNDEDTEIRAAFIQFYSDLLPLIEASFCHSVGYSYYRKNKASPDLKTMPAAIKERLCHDYQCIYITDEEEVYPESVYARFCVKYQIDYVRRELWDFLDAVHFYAGPFRKIVSKHCFADYYLKLLTIVEIAYVYLQRDRHPD
jgi:hypothetical protein